MATHTNSFHVNDYERKVTEDMYDLSKLNKENIPPNGLFGARQVLKDKTNKQNCDSFIKRTHSMDIHLKAPQQPAQPQLNAPSMMNIECMENNPKFNAQMELEDFQDMDNFDQQNKHNPQMVSLYAREIFEYLREREVEYSLTLGPVFS